MKRDMTMHTLGLLQWRPAVLTRSLLVYFALSIVGVSLVLHFIGHATSGPLLSGVTVLHDTKNFVLFPPDTLHYDSWWPIRSALNSLDSHTSSSLYDKVLFDLGIKFQYPPTSLLLFDLLDTVPSLHLTGDLALHVISWLLIIGTALIVARIFIHAIDLHLGPGLAEGRTDRILLAAIAIALSVTFYPLVRAYTLGQVQVWLNFFFAAAVWFWIVDRRRLAGAMIACICIFKPQLGLLLIWALIRKEWNFVTGWSIVFIPAALLSLGRYGIENHFEYLQVISFISQHGEAYFPNNSVNGLLNRILFNGNNLQWQDHEFAPYNPIVHAGTLISSLIFVLLALFWRRGEHRSTAATTDFLIVSLSFTIASPVAWEHHYGILLPIFAVVLPATLARSEFGLRSVILLATAYFLASHYFEFTNLFANSYLNVLQSYLFIGALLLLWHLYQLRHVEHLSATSESAR